MLCVDTRSPEVSQEAGRAERTSSVEEGTESVSRKMPLCGDSLGGEDVFSHFSDLYLRIE